MLDSMTGPIMSLAILALVLRFVYDVSFLKAFGATPGKFALGIEVRLRERPGVMPWGTVLSRWFTQNIASVLQALPVVSLLAAVPLVGGVYVLLDCLWPLWDPHRQALHDKVAQTNVVRRG